MVALSFLKEACLGEVGFIHGIQLGVLSNYVSACSSLYRSRLRPRQEEGPKELARIWLGRESLLGQWLLLKETGTTLIEIGQRASHAIYFLTLTCKCSYLLETICINLCIDGAGRLGPEELECLGGRRKHRWNWESPSTIMHTWLKKQTSKTCSISMLTLG